MVVGWLIESSVVGFTFLLFMTLAVFLVLQLSNESRSESTVFSRAEILI